MYEQKVSLKGNTLDRPYIFHDEVVVGGELTPEMGSIPNKKPDQQQ